VRDRLGNNARRIHARLFDQLAILGVVSAVDASPGEIDDNVRSVEFSNPVSRSLGIPFRNAPRRALRPSAENNNLIAALMKRSSEDRSDLAASAWDYYFQLNPRLPKL
jgi:hypothetical protein